MTAKSVLASIVLFIFINSLSHISYSSTSSTEEVASYNVGGNLNSSINTLLTDIDLVGSLGSSVNLYSGQHQESFPLVSIPGRNNMGVSLSLDYNGNVNNVAIRKNTKIQASEFGLGFSIGGETIICDNKATVDIEDDGFTYIKGDYATRIFKNHDGDYITQDGRLWEIEQYTDTIAGQTCVLGWTITKEDGTKYRFGDFNSGSSSRNATRYIMRWGRSLSNGVSTGDKLYPYQWDISLIYNTTVSDTANSILFEYDHEIDSIYVYNGGSPTYSDNDYTRMSYLSSVSAPGGYKIEMIKGNRTDFLRNDDDNHFQFYKTKKIDSVYVLNSEGNIIQRIALDYSYLNSALGVNNKKLVLTEIKVLAADADTSLPAISFDYHDIDTLDYFGSIKNINYPSGGVKEFSYKILEEDSCAVSLNRSFTNLGCGHYGNLWRASNNLMMMDGICCNGCENYLVRANWNGAWNVDSIRVGDSQLGITPGVSNDGWMATFINRDTISVYRSKSGTWREEKIALSWDADEDWLEIHTGNDYFLIVDYGEYNHDWNRWAATHIYFYKYRESEWTEHKLFDEADPDCVARFINKVSLGIDGLVISYGYQDWGAIHAWKYDYDMDNMILRDVAMNNPMAFMNGDIVAIKRQHNIYVIEWTGSTWSNMYKLDSLMYIPSETNKFTDMGLINNGIVYGKNVYDSTLDANKHYLTIMMKTTSGWEKYEIIDDCNGNGCTAFGPVPSPFAKIWTSGNIAVTYNERGDSLNMWEWNGNPWTVDSSIYLAKEDNDSHLHYTSRFVTDNLIAFAQKTENFDYYLISSVKSSSGEWSSMDTLCIINNLSPSTIGQKVGIGDEFIATNPKYGDPCVYRWDETSWDTVSLPINYPNADYDVLTGSDCVYFESYLTDSSEFNYFKRYKNNFSGKPNIPIVSKVALYKHNNDTNPAVKPFSYIGGLLDPNTNTPKFSRTTENIPYFKEDSSNSKGYISHYYYNDMDKDNNYYMTFDDEIGLPKFVDTLEYDTTFWCCQEWANPPYNTICFNFKSCDGPEYDSISVDTSIVYVDSVDNEYFMDGQEYLTVAYDSSTQVNSEDMLDSIINVHDAIEIGEYNDSNPIYGGIHKILLTSTHSRTEGLTADKWFYYNDSTYQLNATKSKYKEDGTYLIDSIFHAYLFDETMTDSNAIAQVALKSSYYFDSTADTSSLLSAASSPYTFDKGWKTANTYTWRHLDIDSLADTVFSFKSIDGESFDSFGNLVNSIDISKDTSCIKYDSLGLFPIATAVGCYTNDLVAQGFEYGDGWDGWNLRIDENYIDTTSVNLVTGYVGLQISDASGSGGNYASYKFIENDSLSGDLYFMSFWLKANQVRQSDSAIFSIYYTCFDDVSDTCTNGNKSFDLLEVDTNWTLVNGVLDLSDVNRETSMDKLKIELVLANDTLNQLVVYIDDFRFHPIDAHVSTFNYNFEKGLKLSESGKNNIPTYFEYDVFNRPYKVLNHNKEVISKTEYYYSLEDHETFDTLSPNYNKTITYRSNNDSTVLIDYYDGLGNLLQSRMSNQINGTERALVTGIAEYDARGRVVKSYKPYYDLDDSSKVVHYSPIDSVIDEINDYYDGTNAPNCNNIPFSKNIYDDDLKGRLIYSVGPGSVYSDTSKGAEFLYDIDTIYNTISQTIYDQDNNKRISQSDKWSSIAKDITYYSIYDASGDSMAIVSNTIVKHSSIKGNIDSVAINHVNAAESINDTITIRKYWYNDLNQEDSTWRVDYGTIRMFYDKSGNLRFMQNDNRVNDNNFVYFKYDNFGRKIEEGLCKTTVNAVVGGDTVATDFVFIQDSADSKTFPDETVIFPDKRTKYRYQYDHRIDDNEDYFAYGKMVRVENHDSTYFKNHYYDFINYTDSTEVRLLINNSDYKSIVHMYNRLGDRTILKVYPNDVFNDARAYMYYRDKAGRLSSMQEVGVDFQHWPEHAITYATYEYNASSLPVKSILHIQSQPSFIYDTAQIMTYSYDERDMLLSINDLDNVVSHDDSAAPNDCHFALEIDYTPSGNEYYNGLIGQITSKNSTSSSTITRKFDYEYNELGWLTKADEYDTTLYDRVYDYNFLGNRTSIIAESDTIEYIYNTSTAGSSKLEWITGMGSDEMIYDAVGNLIADTSRTLKYNGYDYRNLMTGSRLGPYEVGGPFSYLDFVYDEKSQRIKKRFNYYRYVDCGGGIIPLGMMMGDGGIGGEMCWKQFYTDQHYLYDGNQLLAIFDESDNVTHTYVNGIGGHIAVYDQDDDDKIYYFMKDHLGSTRAMIDAKSRLKQYVNYYPYGEIIESWTNYDEPMKYTEKERDLYQTFDFYYYGARFYDYRIGQFASVDKAAQYPGGYMYGGNNPIMYIDQNGNIAIIPIIIGAAFGAISGYAYADAIGADPLAFMLGGAIVGGFAGYVGAVVGQSSQIGALAASSYTNSLGWQFLSGGQSDFIVNFGIGNLDLYGGKWDWADFGGNLLEDMGTVAGWIAAGKDAFKVAYKIQTTEAGQNSESELMSKEGYEQGELEYTKIDDVNELDGIPLRESTPGRNEFTHPDLLKYNKDADNIVTLRSARGHYKIYMPEYVNGVLSDFGAAEVHFNKIPSMGFGTLKSPLGWLSAGLHIAVDGNEHMWYMFERNMAVRATISMYNTGFHYHVY